MGKESMRTRASRERHGKDLARGEWKNEAKWCIRKVLQRHGTREEDMIKGVYAKRGILCMTLRFFERRGWGERG